MFPDIEYVMKKRYLLNMIMRGVAFLLFSIAAMWALQLIAQLIFFITETATKIFASVDDALTHFEGKGMMAPQGLFGH